MSVVLLDVNVLLALAWPNHPHHAKSSKWFQRESHRGWATCALTQLSFVRLSSNPAVTLAVVAPQEAARILQRNLALPGHVFWQSPSACDPGIFQAAVGHQQVTDAWLVEVARQNGGRFATLDQRLHVHDPSGSLVELIT